jgi:hypothetical protein
MAPFTYLPWNRPAQWSDRPCVRDDNHKRRLDAVANPVDPSSTAHEADYPLEGARVALTVLRGPAFPDGGRPRRHVSELRHTVSSIHITTTITENGA